MNKGPFKCCLINSFKKTMFGLGIWELLIVLAIVVVLFGAKRLPLIGEGLGGMITNFKRATKKNKEEQDKIDENSNAIKENGSTIKEENS